jgi:hypothetical protein
MKRLAVALALCLTVAGPAAGDGPVTRDERAVKVDGIDETWRLEWLGTPDLVCQPIDESWSSCPCQGFAFGEAGELDLVRLRDASEIDRLHLTRFSNADMPPGAEGRFALQRWPVRDIDAEAFERANAIGRRDFRKRVLERKPARILKLADFDHDGWATEFVLQVRNQPCGKRASVLVGVSAGRPKLHAFGSADHPDRPLILQAEAWQQLRGAKGTIRFIELPCGEHGSAVRSELLLGADASGIHAVRETYACDSSGRKQGEPVSRETL